jgi:hypothetical protein
MAVKIFVYEYNRIFRKIVHLLVTVGRKSMILSDEDRYMLRPIIKS